MKIRPEMRKRRKKVLVYRAMWSGKKLQSRVGQVGCFAFCAEL